MFWDKAALFYDFVEDVYNGKVYRGTGQIVAKEIKADDQVLECACGTGAISVYIAPKCRHLIATDLSVGMLRQVARKARAFDNMEVKKADMSHLKCRDNRFDKVVAGNVIHLLDDPAGAVRELVRVCKPGGKVIIPTYINIVNGRNHQAVKVFEKAGANFKRQFDLDSYKKFFRDAGYTQVEYHVVKGRMPCVVAVIAKR